MFYDLNWKAPTSLEEGLRKTIDWYALRRRMEKWIHIVDEDGLIYAMPKDMHTYPNSGAVPLV